MPEFGVLFSLNASVLSPDNEGWWRVFKNGKFKFQTEDGKTIFNFGDSGDDSEQADAQQAYDDAKKADKDAKKQQKREMTEQEILKAREERYENGKSELMTTIMDYGETLNGLRDDQWVGIATFFDDDDIFGGSQGETVVMKAKMADLRAHGSGRISDAEMKNRVVVDEY